MLYLYMNLSSYFFLIFILISSLIWQYGKIRGN